jgi:hypothetical protein
MVIAREAFFSNTVFFAIVPTAKVYANGKPITGWLHKASGARYILTTDALGRRESYWISVANDKGAWISSCGGWSAPRFPLVAIGDVNPPCLTIVLGEDRNPAVPRFRRDPAFRARSVEFTDDDGRRIRASW